MLSFFKKTLHILLFYYMINLSFKHLSIFYHLFFVHFHNFSFQFIILLGKSDNSAKTK